MHSPIEHKHFEQQLLQQNRAWLAVCDVLAQLDPELAFVLPPEPLEQFERAISAGLRATQPTTSAEPRLRG